MKSFKNTLLKKDLLLGSWAQIGHPANVEILAQAGFSWIAADCEHGEFDNLQLGNFCRAVQQYDCLPLVRVKSNDTIEIRRALDLGAMGIIVPLVNNAQQAEKAVAAAKYPPEGVRGFAFHRGNQWGVKFDEYVRKANDEIIVIVMVESKVAVENVDEILDVEGVDGVFVGPYDMSGSYGIIGETAHPLITEACKKVADACVSKGKIAGQHIVLPTKDNVQNAIEQGYRFLALGMDTVFLANGAKESLEMLND